MGSAPVCSICLKKANGIKIKKGGSSEYWLALCSVSCLQTQMEKSQTQSDSEKAFERALIEQFEEKSEKRRRGKVKT